jgi:hypothetical protein
MKPPVGPGAEAEKSVCSRCGEDVERKDLQRCPWCFKDFCYSCRFPRGVADYCSRACAEAMFHGGDSEDGDEDE